MRLNLRILRVEGAVGEGNWGLRRFLTLQQVFSILRYIAKQERYELEEARI